MTRYLDVTVMSEKKTTTLVDNMRTSVFNLFPKSQKTTIPSGG